MGFQQWHFKKAQLERGQQISYQNKHRVRAKRRRKGGTRRGSRYHSKDDDRELSSFLKSTLGQNYDITRCRQLLCPDSSCEVCNNATSEINELCLKALEASTPSMSPVASTAPVTASMTDPSFNQSSAFSGVPPGELIPTPLPEPSQPSPSILPSNSMPTLGNFLSPSPPGQTVPPQPVHHSSPQPKDLCSSTLTQYGLYQGFLALGSTKISSGADPEAKLIDPGHLLFRSPDEHDSAQECRYPKTWGDNIKKNLAQLFWGLPTLHSESLPSAIHASAEYSIVFNSISNSFTDQECPGLSDLQSPSLAEVQPQPLPRTLPQSQQLHLTQIQTQAHLQSPPPILPSSPITQNKICEMNVHIPNNESECHTSSENEHLECNVLLKEQESLWGLTSVAQRSKAHVAISIDPVAFPLRSEFRDKFEHHLRKRLIQHHQGQPCMINGSLSLMRPLSNCSGILESESTSGLSRISVEKDQSSENPNVGLSQPGSFYERSSEMFQIEENEGKEEGHSQENDPDVLLLSDSKASSHKPVDIQGIIVEEIQKILKAKMPLTNTISGKKSQIHSRIANIQPPKLPARRAGTPQETNHHGVDSNDISKIRQGANREKSEPASRPSMSREIVRADRLKALQHKTRGVLTTSQPGISQKIERNTTVATENPPSKISDIAPTLSELRKQLIAEMNLKLESRKHSQAQGQPLDKSSDSDILTYKAPLTPDKCVSSVDTEVHQVLHVQSEDSGVSLEKQQEPWLPKQALRSCQDQNSPPAVKKDIVCPTPEPTGPKCKELGAGDARLRLSRPGGKRFPSQDTALEDMLGSKSSHSQTQTAPSDSLVLHQMKTLFQRLCPSVQCKMQETTQEVGRHTSSAQSRGPLPSRAPFTGTTQVDRRRPAVVTPFPPEPLPSAAQSGKPVQKGPVQAQAEPVQRHHFQRRAPSYDLTNAMSGRHTAILAGQGSTTAYTRNKDRPTLNAVASKQICQKHPQSVPLRGTLPHPNPSCRPQAANGPPAVLTTAGGAACRDQPPRFRHTMLLYNFQGQTFPTPK